MANKTSHHNESKSDTNSHSQDSDSDEIVVKHNKNTNTKAFFEMLDLLLLKQLISDFLDPMLLTRCRPVAKIFEIQWRSFIGKRIFRVPQDFSLINQALTLGYHSSREPWNTTTKLSLSLGGEDHSFECVKYTEQQPLVVVVGEGEHKLNPDNCREIVQNIPFNVNIIGEDREKTILNFGFYMHDGYKLTIKNITLRNQPLHASDRLNVHKRMCAHILKEPESEEMRLALRLEGKEIMKESEEQDRRENRYAVSNKRGTVYMDNVCIDGSGLRFGGDGGSMKNCEVKNCIGTGVEVFCCILKIKGEHSLIHHNCIEDKSKGALFVGEGQKNKYTSIHIVAPLTLEQVSKDNIDGCNWGGVNKICIVDSSPYYNRSTMVVAYDGSPDEDTTSDSGEDY